MTADATSNQDRRNLSSIPQSLPSQRAVERSVYVNCRYANQRSTGNRPKSQMRSSSEADRSRDDPECQLSVDTRPPTASNANPWNTRTSEMEPAIAPKPEQSVTRHARRSKSPLRPSRCGPKDVDNKSPGPTDELTTIAKPNRITFLAPVSGSHGQVAQ